MDRKEIERRNKNIVESYLNGTLNIIQLGKKYGISKQRVSVILMENGVEPKSVREVKTSETKQNTLSAQVELWRHKYSRRSKAVRKLFDKQRLEILNLNNKVLYKEGQVRNLKERIKELEEKLKGE